MASLRENIGRNILKRKRKSLLREVKVQNFDTASKAIILFETSEQETFPVIKDFLAYLREMDIACKVFAYVPQKEVPEELLFWKDYSFITRKDLNWYLKPGGETTQAFYDEAADMLFDFSRKDTLELQYLVQLSPVGFKIGAFTEAENDYDLMIRLEENSRLDFLAEQFKHYIAILNPIQN